MVLVREGARDNMAGLFEMGERMAREATALFRKPIMLEFEKVYSPYVLYGKKMYAAMKYAPPDPSKSKLEVKGLKVVRRDNCDMVRVMYSTMLRSIMERKMDDAVRYLKKLAADLRANKVPRELLVMSKTLRGEYKVTTQNATIRLRDVLRPPNDERETVAGALKLPHIVAARDLVRSTHGVRLGVGDRVEFLYCRDPRGVPDVSLHARHVSRAGDVLVSYYMQNQLLPSARILLTPLYLCDGTKGAKALDRLLAEAADPSQSKITSFFGGGRGAGL